MALDARGLVAVHAAVGGVDEVIEMRRAIYSAALELDLGEAAGRRVDVDVLDNPIVRAQLAELLGGRGLVDPIRLTPVSVFLSDRPLRLDGGRLLRIAANPAAESSLVAALAHIREQLAEHGEDAQAGTLLTVGDRRFGSTRDLAVAGVQLAADVVPDLVDDLLPHVALIAIVAQDRAGRLGSASLRDWPGLIVLPEPRRPVEAAEALLHEGAHQKLFDLMLTRSILSAQPEPPPLFSPPWGAQSAPQWPFEQCLAALHTYCVLAAAAPQLAARAVDLHEHSLLPHAAVRAAVLSEWVVRHHLHLGPAGRRLVAGLTSLDIPESAEPVLLDPAPTAAPDVTRRCGNWTLHLRGGQPCDLWWVPTSRIQHAE